MRKSVREEAEREYAYSWSTHVIALHCIVRVCHKSVHERISWLGRKDLQEVEAPPTLLTGAHLSIVEAHASEGNLFFFFPQL